MDKLIEIYNRNKEKVVDSGGGDKNTVHSYISHYDELLTPYRKNSTFLEIGIWRGQSIKMWDEYFIDSTVVGVEIFEDRTGGLHNDPNYNVLVADATKLDFLDKIKDYSFDVIIDDGSHYLHEQIISFNLLKHKMNKGGIYIIEDIKDIDYAKHYFEGSLHDNCEIRDLRKEKNRKDDVLVIYRF
tara:strand:+ start:439 stop:993 length:555 start_codon:yes stop_codon:yes gene_type:complete